MSSRTGNSVAPSYGGLTTEEGLVLEESTPLASHITSGKPVDHDGTGAGNGNLCLNQVGTFYKSTGDSAGNAYTSPSRLVLHGQTPVGSRFIVDAANAAVGSGGSFTITGTFSSGTNPLSLAVTAGATPILTAQAIRDAIEADATWKQFIHVWIPSTATTQVWFYLWADSHRNLVFSTNDAKVTVGSAAFVPTGGVQLLGNYLFDTEYQFYYPPQGRRDIEIQGVKVRPPHWLGYGSVYASRDQNRYWPEIISDGIPRLKVFTVSHSMLTGQSAGVKAVSRTIDEWVAAAGITFGEDFDASKVQFIRDVWIKTTTPWTNGAAHQSFWLSVGRKGFDPSAGGTIQTQNPNYDLLEATCTGYLDAAGNQQVAANMLQASDADWQFGNGLNWVAGTTALAQLGETGPSPYGVKTYTGVVPNAMAATNAYGEFGPAIAAAAGTLLNGFVLDQACRLVGMTVKYMDASAFTAGSSDSIKFELGTVAAGSAPTQANFAAIPYYGKAPYSASTVNVTFAQAHHNTYPVGQFIPHSEHVQGGLGVGGRGPIFAAGTFLGIKTTKSGTVDNAAGATDADFLVTLTFEPVAQKGYLLREKATPWLNKTDGSTNLAYHNAEMSITVESFDPNAPTTPDDINSLTGGVSQVYVLYDELSAPGAYSNAFMSPETGAGGRSR